jgi:primosomal protein N''
MSELDDLYIRQVESAIKTDEARIRFSEGLIATTINNYISYLDELAANISDPELVYDPEFLTQVPTKLACLWTELNAYRRELEDWQILRGTNEHRKRDH